MKRWIRYWWERRWAWRSWEKWRGTRARGGCWRWRSL